MRYRLSVNMFAINVFAMGWFLLGLTFIAKAEDPPPPLPGEFVIQTMVKRTYLTAVEGGGRTPNVIHTDAKPDWILGEIQAPRRGPPVPR